MQAEQAKHEGSLRLGGARADFVAGLGRKVGDLRAAMARVRATPADLAPREELRRKLHALASGSKLMKFDAMERGIAEAIGTIDRTAIDAALDAIDLDAIEQLIEDLPALAWGDGHARSSRVEETQKVAPPRWNVLIVGTPLIAEALMAAPEAGKATFDCECTPDAQAAYDLVRVNGPDLVVLDADIEYASELVEAMMDDAHTEEIPLVVVGSFLSPGESARYVAMGVTKTLPKPTSRETLRAICEAAVDPGQGDRPARVVIGEPTLAELGEILATELKEALVTRATGDGRDKKVPLGEGTEVLGAVWGAIARIREVVTARTDGSVRFAQGPEGALTMALPLHDTDVARSDRSRTRARGMAPEVRLHGRRVVIADDDPAVVWFLADLLKTAGCIVHEAFDGQQALELAYKTSPDVVISDILMPNLDGFSLCRALRRDVALRDTPVILLSWKEDLLQRVRELGAGAAGYVRKESDTRAIVARVREALRPRARIEARLRDDGEVRGRLDGISVRTLLEIVCATRPEARVSIRDASFLYEVEIRWGAPHRATRSSGDGSFMKGPQVLAAMLGVGAGRFTVATSLSPVEAELDGNLASQLAKPIARARAATMLLTGSPMTSVAHVAIDEVSLGDYLNATPARARSVAQRIANGSAPRDVVLDGLCEASLLEDLVCDLASRGAITAIEDDAGGDLFGPTITRLLELTDTRASFAPRTATPTPVPTRSARPGECTNDAAAPLCKSPAPGATASLEEAVLREVAPKSPTPAPAVQSAVQTTAQANAAEAATALPEPSTEIRVPTPTPEPSCTPPAEQIMALAEPTIVDDTVYGRDDEDEEDRVEATATAASTEDELVIKEPSQRLEKTPFATVTSDDSTDDDVALFAKSAKKKKKRSWSTLAFLFGTGLVAWAVMHYGNKPVALRTTETAPMQETSIGDIPSTKVDTKVEPAPNASATGDATTPSRRNTGSATTNGANNGANGTHAPATGAAKPTTKLSPPAPKPTATDVAYTPVAAGANIQADQGVLDVSAPADAVVVVDGTERARGSATLPIASGSHDVRVRTTAEERGCTVDVHATRVAHIKFH